MKKYYTRACNFYYGLNSKYLIKNKKTLPLKGNLEISFDHIEILSRNYKKKIHIKKIKKLPKNIKDKINQDLKKIIKKDKNFSNFKFNNNPNIMGILNLTPDSFSDGNKFNKKNISYIRARHLVEKGANIIDIGGESTRPGSKDIKSQEEWQRIKFILKKLKKKINLSLDTRKSEIMEKGINLGVKLINDISGFGHDKETIKILKKYNTPFIINHIHGTPINMQKNPKYNDVILDIYDYFEEKIKFARDNGIKHNHIIIDPGIGFGKKLKHNMKLISNISIFHSLGFPVLLGISRKSFIKGISGINDDQRRLGGTVSSSLFAMMQGIQILRVHDVNDVMQGMKVFKELIKN